MILKPNTVLDLAYNNAGSDLRMLQHLVGGAYIKATEGYYTDDVLFPSGWPALLWAGVPRAAYHFYWEKFAGVIRDPIRQAQRFVGVVNRNGGLVRGDLLVLDLETPGISIVSALKFQREAYRLTGIWCLWYSRANILNELAGWNQLTAQDRADVKRTLIITAGYPYDPDLYDRVPGSYVPDQLRYGRVIGWQYAGDTPNEWFPGIVGKVDLNWFEPEFLRAWRDAYSTEPAPPDDPPPTPPTPPDPSQDLTVTDQTVALFHAGGTDVVTYHVVRARRSVYELVPDSRYLMNTPVAFASLNRDVVIATNGGAGWYSVRQRGRTITNIYGFSAYRGTGFGKLSKYWQQVWIDKDGRWSLDRPRTLYSTFPFTNLLVKDGEVQDIDKVTDYRARTAAGISADGEWTYQVVVDGGDYNADHGMSFQEVALLMRDLGCDLAVMLDGGGSSCLVQKDDRFNVRVIGTPDGEMPVVIDGKIYNIRPTAGHLGLRRRS